MKTMLSATRVWHGETALGLQKRQHAAANCTKPSRRIVREFAVYRAARTIQITGKVATTVRIVSGLDGIQVEDAHLARIIICARKHAKSAHIDEIDSVGIEDKNAD